MLMKDEVWEEHLNITDDSPSSSLKFCQFVRNRKIKCACLIYAKHISPLSCVAYALRPGQCSLNGEEKMMKMIRANELEELG
jgi:hypothetical protein